MTVSGAALFAVFFFLVPGFLISWVAGAKAPAAVASALPVTFGVVGLGAWVWGETSAPFNLVTFSISLLFALICAALWRWIFVRRTQRGTDSSWRSALFSRDWRSGSILDPYWIIPAAGVVTGAWIFINARLSWLKRAPHEANNIIQGWDVNWHANVVRFILDEGIASPTRMGELQNVESQSHLLYPSAFHSAVALFARATGLEPIPALNIAMAVLPSIALPLAMACLVFAVIGGRGLTAQIGAAVAAVAVYAVPTILWIPEYMGMWPYLTAVLLAGIVIWQFCSVPAHPATVFPTTLGFVGVLVVHPSAVTIVAFAVTLFWLTRLLFAPVVTRSQDLLWLALPVVGASALFAPQILLGSSQAEEVTAWSNKSDTGTDAPWEAILLMRTRHSQEFFPDFDPTLLLWLAGVGALALIVWRRQVWPVLFFALSAVLAVSVLEPSTGWVADALGALSSLHYSSSPRLVIPVSIFTVVGAAVGLAVVIRLVALAPLAARRGTSAWTRSSVVISVALAIAAVGGTVWWVQDRVDPGAENIYSVLRKDDRMINDDDISAFDWLATQPGARDGYIMGEPADGHSWMYAYNGLPSVSRHYQWPTGGAGASFDTLALQMELLGKGQRSDKNAENPVDEAAHELDIKFIFLSPANFWVDQTPRYEMLKGLWTSEAVTPVYRQGTTAIFAVNDAYTPAQLNEMVSDGRKNGSEEMPKLVGFQREDFPTEQSLDS